VGEQNPTPSQENSAWSLSLSLLELIDQKNWPGSGWMGSWHLVANLQWPFCPLLQPKRNNKQNKNQALAYPPKTHLEFTYFGGEGGDTFQWSFGCWVEINFFFFHIGRDSLFPSYYNFRTWSRGNYQMKTRQTLDIKLILSFKNHTRGVYNQCS
jgi:hypothetical protein